MGQMAKALRAARPLTSEEIAVLKAAVALRTLRGMYRDRYQPDEVQLVARARRMALEVGQLKLSRVLTLRRPWGGPSTDAVTIKPLGFHRCALCGHPHRPPTVRALSAPELAKDIQVVKVAYSKLPKDERSHVKRVRRP